MDELDSSQTHTSNGGGRHIPNKRLFGPPPIVGDNFVDKLLDRDIAYDPELAYVCSIIAGWSYSNRTTLERRLKYYGLAKATVQEIAVLNPSMMIVSTAFFVRSACGRIAILSFRGTEPTNLISWLTDSDVSQRNFAGTGQVHEGFYENLQAVWEDVDETIDKATDRLGDSTKAVQKLFITGHSLGAAMAVIAAAKLSRDGSRATRKVLSGVYTFGQPAVGDAEFVAYFEPRIGDRLYRHDYAFDAVPRLPPASTGDFRHFGELRVARRAQDGWTSSHAALHQAGGLSLIALSVLSSFVGRRIQRFGPLERWLCKYSLFDDHSPKHYIDASRAALAST
jgi:hypothetical protein